MRLLKAIWENLYGLLVDDGRLAAGALIVLLFSAAVGQLAPNDAVRGASGFLFLILICALLLQNLYAAGRNAGRQRIAPSVNDGPDGH